MKTIITFSLLLLTVQSVLSQVDKISKDVESIVLQINITETAVYKSLKS